MARLEIQAHHPEKGLRAFSQRSGSAREILDALDDALDYVVEATRQPYNAGSTITLHASFGRGSTKRSYTASGEQVFAKRDTIKLFEQ